MTPRRAIVLALGVLCLGIGLAAVDTIHEGERFDAADFALELLEWAGLVGAVTAAVWIATRPARPARRPGRDPARPGAGGGAGRGLARPARSRRSMISRRR